MRGRDSAVSSLSNLSVAPGNPANIEGFPSARPPDAVQTNISCLEETFDTNHADSDL